MPPSGVRIGIPDNVSRILGTLREAGFEAYIVGGCVRDSLIGREPGDWDITTSARPERVRALFRRTVDTGIAHGTVTVLMDREGYEVTTYRIDGAYEDARHPKQVTFTPLLSEDLRRRDFTINAMAYSEEDGLIDLFDGMGDIRRRTVRAVGDPAERFSEDALRIMRAYRFSAQLGYAVEAGTAGAASALAQNLSRISAERIRTELEKLLVSDDPGTLRAMYAAGITAVILPELDSCMAQEQRNPHHAFTVGEHLIRSVEACRPDRVLRLAMLLHDIGKPYCRTTDPDGTDHFRGHPKLSAEMADRILRRLKYDNGTRESVVTLIRYHDLDMGGTPAAMRRSIGRVGERLFPLLFEVKEADMRAQSSYMREEKEERLRAWREQYLRIVGDGDCLSLKDLAVNGRDLIAAGVTEGREIGRVLRQMLDAVLEDPARNDRDFLMRRYLDDALRDRNGDAGPAEGGADSPKRAEENAPKNA